MAFERDINLKIIQQVEKYECLYNFNLSEYSKKDLTEKAWAKVSKKINLSVHECKDKWKNIRSAFVRSLKPSSTAKFRKPYYLHEYLTFILPYVKHVSIAEERILKSEMSFKTEDTIMYDDEASSPQESVSNESDNDSTTLSSVAAQRKRKVDEPDELISEYTQSKKDITNTGSSSDNETAKRYFLLSLLPELNGLNEDQMRHFKIQVLLLIDNIKGNSITSQSFTTRPSPQPSTSLIEPPYTSFPKPGSDTFKSQQIGTPTSSSIS